MDLDNASWTEVNNIFCIITRGNGSHFTL